MIFKSPGVTVLGLLHSPWFISQKRKAVTCELPPCHYLSLHTQNHTTEASGRKSMKDSPPTLNRRITAYAVRTTTNLSEYENLSLPFIVRDYLRSWHSIGGS